MIHEVDSALRALIERETGTRDVEVVFDAPTRDWAGRRNSPTIDVYLYDIREDLRRRERGVLNEYNADQTRIVGRHLPPRHFKLSYLITAWTQRPEDEHRLLSSLLMCFLRFDALPPELLGGPLAALGLPVPVTVALPAAGGPRLRRRLVRPGWGAQAVHRRGGQHPDGHRPAVRGRPGHHPAAAVRNVRPGRVAGPRRGGVRPG